MLFGKDTQWWKDQGAYWTAVEIGQQPATWKKTIEQIQADAPVLDEFTTSVLADPRGQVVLTGAGTSEFVGNAIFPYLSSRNDFRVHSFATTDLVAAPQYYIDKSRPVLLVSYGRSGNSPESVGAVETVNALSDKVKHLFITCNKDGALSKFAQGNDTCLAVNLTPETHDQSFAMTSSFTNMYLATLLALGQDLEGASQDALLAAEKGQAFLDTKWDVIQDVVDSFDFDRIVYLGSNNLKGVAQESALKMCELTGGEVDTIHDTPMGFRHGPKSVINPATLTVLYLSDEPYTRQYELDILKEMAPQRKGNKILVVSSKPDPEAEALADWFISMDNGRDLENVYLGLEYVMAAQLLAMFKSIKSGHTPDNPCPTGEVNRVVKGVTIYPWGE